MLPSPPVATSFVTIVPSSQGERWIGASSPFIHFTSPLWLSYARRKLSSEPTNARSLVTAGAAVFRPSVSACQ